MPETKTDTPPPGAEGEPKTETFAGKYKGVEAFTKGVNELRERAGFAKIDKPLFGEGGMFPDAQHAETYYAGLKQVHDLDPASRVSPKTAAAPKQPDAPAKEPKAEGDLTIKDAASPELKGIQKVLAKAGLAGKEGELTAAWVKDGKLTDEQYAALAKADRDRDEVDAFFSSQAELSKTRAASYRIEGEKIAGGPEQHNMLREWARTDLKEDPTFKMLNKAVEADASQYPALIGYVDAKYKATNGTVKAQTRGGVGGNIGLAVSSEEESNSLHQRVASGDPDAIAQYRAAVKAGGIKAVLPNIGKFNRGV